MAYFNQELAKQNPTDDTSKHTLGVGVGTDNNGPIDQVTRWGATALATIANPVAGLAWTAFDTAARNAAAANAAAAAEKWKKKYLPDKTGASGVGPPGFDPVTGGIGQGLAYNPGSAGFGQNNFGGQSAFGGYDPYGGRYVPTERMFTQLEGARMQSTGYPTAFGPR